MKICWILALLGCTVPGLALGGGMQKATVHAMRKVHCTQSIGGILGTIVGPSEDSECIEYEVRTEKVSYFIRPNRAILLLLDSDVSIKLAGNELLLHTSASVKDIRCNVVSMSLRSDSDKDKKERNYQDSRRCRTESGKEIPCADEPEDVRYQVAP